MSNSAKSVTGFGGYLVGMGFMLIFLPNTLMSLLGIPNDTSIWSRIVGVMAMALGFYYIQAARSDLQVFFRWTIYARIAVFFVFTSFVVAGLAGPIMILLGSVDLLGALLTAWCLHQETQHNRHEASRAA